jgi:hypothetical protein
VGGGVTWIGAVDRFGLNSVPVLARSDGPGGWVPVPAPVGPTVWNTIYSVSGVAPDNVWVAGRSETPTGQVDQDGNPILVVKDSLAHWDGSTLQWTGITAALVDALAPDDAWALGYDGLFHWDGVAWVRAGPGFDADYSSMSALRSGDVWVSTDKYSPEATIEHWDGTAWTTITLPRDDGARFTDVSAISRADVWAVGFGSGGGANYRGLIAHWNGATWDHVWTSPGRFESVTAISDGDVWVAGLKVFDPNGGYAPSALLRHWNGHAWSRSRVGELAAVPSDQMLEQTTADPDGTVTVAGTIHGLPVVERLTPISIASPLPSLVLSRGAEVWWRTAAAGHRLVDGQGLRLVDTGVMAAGETTSHTFSIAGAFTLRDAGQEGAERISVAPSLNPGVLDPGAGGSAVRWADHLPPGVVADVEVQRPQGEPFLRWRTGLTSAATRFTPDAGIGLYRLRVRVRRPAAGAVSGWSPAVTLRVRRVPLAGSTWTRVTPTVLSAATRENLVAITPGEAWVAAAGFLRLDGSHALRVPGVSAYAVDATGPANVWAVGQTIRRFDGRRWVGVPTRGLEGMARSGLSGVETVSATDAWVSARNSVAHWNGSSWTRYPLAEEALDAVSANDAWAVGSEVSHWDGERWTAVATPDLGAEVDLVAVHAIAHDNVYAVGTVRSDAGYFESRGVVEHWDGSAWSVVLELDPGVWLSSVSASGPNDVWAVGEIPSGIGAGASVLEHWDGSAWSSANSVRVPGDRLDIYRDELDTVAVLPSGRALALLCCTRREPVLYQLQPMQLTDRGFVRPLAWVRQGRTVVWHLSDADRRRHSIADGSGIDLFDSGLLRPGGSYMRQFDAAGTYTVKDATSGSTATVEVPLMLDGSALLLSAAPLQGGVVADVQLQAPGALGFSDWLVGTTQSSTPLPAEPGGYAFRARLRDPATGAATGWSPVKVVTIG